MSDLALDGPHWTFALAVYRQPGVSEACLALQDGCGLDVNTLLVGLYAWSVGDDGFAGDRLADIDAAIEPMREGVVKPLRGVRRQMKGMAEARFGVAWDGVRNRVKSAELSAEQFEQALLANHVMPGGASQGSARAAGEAIVDFYAGRAGASAADFAGPLAVVVAAAEAAAR
ncbi:TIGR02444 family protein [Devosia enhydra]|uniref:TIGR02444 family protein n=1 Tax=Devosia enhydra TaxID=665118 RepID=A0A1K2HXN7_9HYPH|nr:TIGR02444 family protein [Devosia enhydra]SFZ83086.1 TIGR02444 family protein [Devosia enhydra]